ncbi:MAG TPA: hypothetical protein VE912_12365 [Bacteroidales bacterium]|nr:hypothetical protein [Bacteroidales bacterium]
MISLTKQIILDEIYVQLWFDQSSKLLVLDWKGRTSGEEYRNTYGHALAFAEQNKVDYFLSDIRDQQLSSSEEEKWFEEVVIPRAVMIGLKKAAVVFEGNLLKKYFLNNILLKLKKYGLPFKFFTDDKEALNWLTQAT